MEIFPFWPFTPAGLEPLTFRIPLAWVSLLHHYTTRFSIELILHKSFLFYLIR